jgi:hypothetical protein
MFDNREGKVWEYQLIEMNRPSPEVQDTLNALGEQRWEFVAVYVSNAGYNVFILKRPKAVRAARRSSGRI